MATICTVVWKKGDVITSNDGCDVLKFKRALKIKTIAAPRTKWKHVANVFGISHMETTLDSLKRKCEQSLISMYYSYKGGKDNQKIYKYLEEDYIQQIISILTKIESKLTDPASN